MHREKHALPSTGMMVKVVKISPQYEGTQDTPEEVMLRYHPSCSLHISSPTMKCPHNITIDASRNTQDKNNQDQASGRQNTTSTRRFHRLLTLETCRCCCRRRMFDTWVHKASPQTTLLPSMVGTASPLHGTPCLFICCFSFACGT